MTGYTNDEVLGRMHRLLQGPETSLETKQKNKERARKLGVRPIPMSDIRIDPKLMINVVQNLISNASKYCRETVPTLEITSDAIDQGFIITFSDNPGGFESNSTGKYLIKAEEENICEGFY